MPNSYFKFKQFTIHQDRSAQKVCTDSCVFGAWINPTAINGVQNILDIGTGTALLSLMIAQRVVKRYNRNDTMKSETQTSIPVFSLTAVELDIQTAVQAQENVRQSPFASYINVKQDDIRTWSESIPPETFTSIVCNPPFFSDSMPSSDIKRLHARHTVSLSYHDVCQISSNVLVHGGELFLLYPFSQHDSILGTAGSFNLFPADVLEVRTNLDSKPHRVCTRFVKSYQVAPPLISSLAIYNSDQSYTESALDLLKEYYLYL
jgi:tRNA1Val (adenine37-N6)-methyltransferase